MKRFDFKLEKLLTIREYNELEAKLKYARELQKKLDLENKNIDMQKSILQSTIDSYSNIKNGDIINNEEMTFQENYINNLIKMIKTLSKLKEELTEAMKKRKIITQLKNKKYEKYKKETKKEDIKRLDEIANQLNLFTL